QSLSPASRSPRRDHDGNRAGVFDGGGKIWQRLRRKEAAFAAVLGDELVSPLGIAVEDRDAELMPRRISRQVCAHDGQSQNANVSLFSHRFLRAVFGAS